VIAKLYTLLAQLLCTHSADYREVLELSVVSGARAARFRCVHCGATLWRYYDRPLTKTPG
jgi:transposase-like protein